MKQWRQYINDARLKKPYKKVFQRAMIKHYEYLLIYLNDREYRLLKKVNDNCFVVTHTYGGEYFECSQHENMKVGDKFDPKDIMTNIKKSLDRPYTVCLLFNKLEEIPVPNILVDIDYNLYVKMGLSPFKHLLKQ
jgi:hypothetical protein